MTSKTLTLAEINEVSADAMANVYADKYRDLIDVYESLSIKSRIKESISPYEIVALGQQFDQFNNYVKFCESQGNLGSLGNIPQVALDVITAAVGGSILPLLCSIQPMAEEHGIVYYKSIKAAQTSGGYTKGDVIASPLARDNPSTGGFGGSRRKLTLDTTVNATVEYTGTMSVKPVRPYRVDISVAGVGIGKDDGAGNILGFGYSGTINYTTGEWAITFTANPGDGKAIEAIVDADVDALDSLDKVEGNLLTKDIRAEIWALAADVGAFANFAFSQRFGRSAVDEVAADLTNEITRVMNTNAILRLIANLPNGSNTNWDRTPPDGVSYAEHKLTFIDAIASAESLIHSQSGANVANRYICGKVAAAVLRGMPNFEIAPDAANVSVGLYGYYDGVPVIRATGVVDDSVMLALSNSGNYFNAPLAYAPFMPLMVTNTVQSPNNPFRQTTAAGVWAGLTALNGNLTTQVTFTQSGS